MMVLYSGIRCPFSHRCRIVLYEKGMDFEIKDVDIYNKPEDLIIMNPYNQVPVLAERDLILYESNIINEYIDEKFPHPQLMPSDPAVRAKSRLILYRLEKEIFSHIKELEEELEENNKESKKAQDRLRMNKTRISEGLIQLSPIVKNQKYLMGDEFSILDVALVPLLWRLDLYGISLGNSAAPILKYAERIFQRESFINSLTASEKAMRK